MNWKMVTQIEVHQFYGDPPLLTYLRFQLAGSSDGRVGGLLSDATFERQVPLVGSPPLGVGQPAR